MPLPWNEITPIPSSGPDAVPSLWNDRYLQIDDNFEYLQDGLADAVEDIAGLDSRLSGVEVSGPMLTAAAVKSDWYYRANKTFAELWATYWTLLDYDYTVPSGVGSGEYSIDVSTSAGLVIGYEYIIKSGSTRELIVISQILSPTRILITTALQHTYAVNATIRRTSFAVDQVAGVATAYDTEAYYCGPMALGAGALKSCVIRRNADTVSPLLMYYKDDAHSSWTAVLWALKRTMADGTIEVEYVFPADGGGNIQVKLVCSATAPENYAEIYGIIFLSEYSGLGGTERTAGVLDAIALAKALTDNSVTLAKLADIATASIIGRNSSGTGDPEVLSVATIKTMLGLGSAAYTATSAYAPAAHVGAGDTAHAAVVSGGVAGFMTGADKSKLAGIAANANNYAHPNHSGDVASSGDGAQTIANNAVTLAKMADMATASLLGRNTAGSGDPEVLSAETVKAILGIGSELHIGGTYANGAYVGKVTLTISDSGTSNAVQVSASMSLFPTGVVMSLDYCPALLKNSSCSDDYSLNTYGSNFRILEHPSNLTVISVLCLQHYQDCGTAIQCRASVESGAISILVFNAATAAGIDLTSLVDSGNHSVIFEILFTYSPA